MPDSEQGKTLAAAMEHLSETIEHGSGNKDALSYEKIVGAVITLIVTGACLWVGTTINSMSRELIELRVTVSEQGKQITTYINTMQSHVDQIHALEKRIQKMEVELEVRNRTVKTGANP